MAAQLNKTPILNPNNPLSFQLWRERYKFVKPLNITRKESELRTRRVEQLVRENILVPGTMLYKSVISEILLWGGGKKLVPTFQRNSEKLIKDKVNEVLDAIRANSDNVSHFISILIPLQAIKIVFASKILRFLDPDNHRYGALDKFVAAFCNRDGTTSFEFNAKCQVLTNPHNVSEYFKYHQRLHQIALKLKKTGIKFTNTDGVLQDFTPVDVEMAIFAYCTQSGGC